MKKKTFDLIDSALAACFIEPKGDPNRSNCITATYLIKALINEGIKIEEFEKSWIKYLRKGNLGKHDFFKEIEDREKWENDDN